MDLGMKMALHRLVHAYMDSQQVDLLTLRDELDKLSTEVNDRHMNTPVIERYTCFECKMRFSIVETPKENRCPDTCAECYEKSSRGQISSLREPKYEYKREDRETIIPEG